MNRLRLGSWDFLYPRAECLRPWKVVTFLAGTALMVVGSFFSPAPDRDVGISLIMPTLTYLTAPCFVRVFADRKWRSLPIALLAAWISVDGAYALYWYLKDADMLALMRMANAEASTPLYGLCGVFWLYRGSSRQLVADTRLAFTRHRQG